MGIPGLWAELAPAAQTTTLPSYCLTSFSENANELRGLRLGVDASLWLFHAQQSSGGANPYLRLLFYRLAKLLSLPVLPLFVFDGPNRPTWKRGKQVKGRQHAIEQPFTQLIEAFGYRWHRAPGEAEAELAYLNQAALVDAVLTDDSDALLFGAQVLIRNWGKNLSGKKALSRAPSASSDVFDDGYYPAGSVAAGSQLQLSGSDRDHLITLYRAHDLVTMSNLGIDRDGLILVALMSGGDYDATGLMQCGVKIALALARGGFGTTLIQAFKASYPDQESAHRSCPTFESFIKTWLEDVREELRTNERGFLPSRRPKLASSIEEKFLSTQESRKVLAFYVYPLTSEINNRGAALTQSCAEPDLTRLARLCQIYFHWSRDAILSKFRTILGPGVVTRCLRQEVLERNDGAGEGPWAALVESPASKAVRRHRLDLDAEASRCSGGATSSGGSAAAASKATAVAAMQRKQRPLHESPNATRITDFFAKAALNPTIDAGTRSSTMDTVVPTSSVEILAIKIQRRHAALDPFLDYRVLVSMDEFTKLAALGVDARLDAELAANRVQEDGSDTDATGFEEADEGEHHQQGQVRNGGKKIAPEAPLLMWIPEPLLQLSTSGHAPLATFCKEVERKANASRTKGSRKAVGGGASSAKGAQTTLNSFVKPMAKPSLSQRTAKSVSASAAESRAREAVPVPLRTPRQLRVPSGMQRGMQRTESVPIALPNSSRGLGRTTFLPTRTDPIVLSDEEALDSSIEFLGALTSITHGGKVHDRSSTPPNQTSSEAEGQGRRLNKSPKKGSSATRHRSPTSFSALGQVKGRLPSQRALAEPTAPDSDGETDDVAAAGETVQCSFPSFDARLAQTRKSGNKSKPRISTIVIVDSSEGTP